MYTADLPKVLSFMSKEEQETPFIFRQIAESLRTFFTRNEQTHI